MTREEAIQFIGQSVKSDVDMALVSDAIKSLEQERSAIEELKKIKEEIEEYMIISFCEDDDIRNIRKIIDNHISELKGENNV